MVPAWSAPVFRYPIPQNARVDMDFPGDLGDRTLSLGHHLRRFGFKFSGVFSAPFCHLPPFVPGRTLLDPLSGMREARQRWDARRASPRLEDFGWLNCDVWVG